VLLEEVAVPLWYMPVPDKCCPMTKMNIMTWSPSLSTFVLNGVCDLIKRGVRMDCGFKEAYLKDVAESILNYYGRVVALEQIYSTSPSRNMLR
jgi:hypothetical protein